MTKYYNYYITAPRYPSYSQVELEGEILLASIAGFNSDKTLGGTSLEHSVEMEIKIDKRKRIVEISRGQATDTPAS